VQLWSTPRQRPRREPSTAGRIERRSGFVKCANPIIGCGSSHAKVAGAAALPGETSMQDVIAFILGNFMLTFFVLGLLASAIALWWARPPRSLALIVEALFSYFVLFSIGFANLYNFVLHVFFGKLAASFIGWEDSPFQLEVGFASLGFAVVGLLAFRGSFDLRLAAIVGPACFLWGAAGVRVYQMITAHNFAPGNAGIIFYSDILVPMVGFIFLWLQHRSAASQQVR